MEPLTASNIKDYVTINAFYKMHRRACMKCTIVIPKVFALYENVDICTLPADVTPIHDEYYPVISGNALGIMIIYASGKICARFFLNPLPAGNNLHSFISWDVVK